jgi:hypothetical protein
MELFKHHRLVWQCFFELRVFLDVPEIIYYLNRMSALLLETDENFSMFEEF